MEGPDRALIELNTAAITTSATCTCSAKTRCRAGEWYMKHLGATTREAQLRLRASRGFIEGSQVGPSMSLMMDNVNIIIFPIQYSKKDYKDHWKNGQTEMSPTKGRVVDHVGFSFDNLAEALEKMRKDGVKVTDEIKSVRQDQVRFHRRAG